jgi:hypothetical protein
MFHETVRSALLAAIAVVAAGGCKKVVKNPQDSSLPKVEIKVRGADGQYAVASTATMKAGQAGTLELMCVVSDPDGVKSIQLNFTKATDSCNLDGQIGTGSFPLEPVPDDMHQSLQGDASDQVITTVPLLATLTGPFSCTVPSPPAPPESDGQGVPYGGELTVTCYGSNWSSDAAKDSESAKLVVTLE